MKKILLYVTLIVMLFGIKDVKAATVNSADISPSTYVIGKYMYTRNVNQEANYDGRLTTQRIMLASRTISKTNEADMIIYYKTASGKWINALTGQNITVPTTFDVEVIDLNGIGTQTSLGDDYETFELDKDKIDNSTYVIGDYIYTRNKNAETGYDGKLTTQRIMLASRTISKTNEADMIIYYKTARGIWIDALTGQEVTPPQKFAISTVDLINQVTGRMKAIFTTGTLFNKTIKQLAGNKNADNDTIDENILKIKKANSLDTTNLTADNIVSASDSQVFIYAWYDNGTIYYYPNSYFDNVDVYLNNNASKMFYRLSNVIEIELDLINTDNTTDMSYLFSGCKKLTDINLSNINTSSVINMSSMFASCSSLTDINLSKFNTSKVTNMSSMFLGCNGLTNINLNNFNTSKVTNMASMFSGCSGLTHLNLTNFDTSQVTRVDSMFFDCRNISSLDLSSFDLSNVSRVSGMFISTGSLSSIKTPKVNPSIEISLNKTMIDSNGNLYTKLDANTPVKTEIHTTTMLVEGRYFNEKIKAIAENVQFAFTTTNDESITKIMRETNPSKIPNGVIDNKNNIVSTSDSYKPVYVWYDNGILYYYSEDPVILLNQNSSSMFESLSKVTEIDLSGFDTSNVTNMALMFNNCSSLTSLDLSNFDTANVTSMSSMFKGCSSLKNFDLSSFDMSKVTEANNMFYNTTLLSSIKTQKVNPLIEIDIRKSLYDSNGNLYTKLDANTPTDALIYNRTTLPSGRSFNEKIKKLAGNAGTSYSTVDERITKIKRETNKNNIPNGVLENSDNIISKQDSYYPVYVWFNNGVIYYYTEESTVFLPSNIDYMFNYLTEVSEIDLSGFDTSNVTNMSNMFQKCSSLTSLDLSNFDMSKVTSVSAMFSYTTSLKEIKTPKVNPLIELNVGKTMYDSNDNEYTKIDSTTPTETTLRTKTMLVDGSSFNKKIKQLAGNANATSSTIDKNITKIIRETNINNIPSGVIGNNDNIVSLDYSYYPVYAWYTNGILYYYSEDNKIFLNNNLNSLLKGLSNLTSINLSNFDTSNVTNMSYMFDGCSSLTSINLSNFDTSNVTNMSYMFYGCSSLTSINLSNFDTSNATNMSGMFYGCSSLTNINLSNFNTSNVTNMSRMFSNCTGLTSLNMSNFNTSKVTDMSYMFDQCSSLRGLDLGSFDMSKVTSLNYILSNTTSLAEIKTPKVNPSMEISIGKSLFDSNDNEYTKIDSNTPTKTILKTKTIFAIGSNFNAKIKQLAGNANASISTVDENITKFIRETNVNNIPNGVIGNSNYLISASDSYKPIYAWYNNGVIYYYSEDSIIYLNSNSNSMFSRLTKIVEIDVSSFNTSKVTSMSGMFRECSSLTSLDLISFDTSKVTDMSSMFDSCRSLSNLRLSSFNTSNVTDMSFMFSKCESFSSIILVNFDTSKVTNMSSMFSGCSRMVSVYLNSFNTSNVTDMSYMFYGCSSLIGLDLSSFNTSNVTNMSNIFCNCSSLTSLNISSFNTSNVTNMSGMFFKCSSLVSLDLSNFNTSNVTNMSSMLRDCSSLTSLNISSFNTNNVTNMAFMFSGCSSLISLNVSSFNTSNVTDMSGMFSGCSSLTSLDLINFNTSKVTNMYSMFSGCSSLTSLDLISFDTSKVTNMSSMFYNCRSLSNLRLSSFNTSNVTDMSFMFSKCESFSSIILVNFDTSKVTNMRYMFSECYSMVNVYLNSFNTSNVTDMSCMFASCGNLTGLDLSSFDTSKVTNMNSMFNGCSSITTAWARTSVDAARFNASSYIDPNVTFVVKP